MEGLRMISVLAFVILLLVSSDDVTFDQSEARIFLQFARTAFCQEAGVADGSCGDMCTDAPIDKNSLHWLEQGPKWGVQGFVALRAIKGTRACIASFRGSVNVHNWFADALAMRVEWPGQDWCQGCEVHLGFLEAFTEMQANMKAALDELQCDSIAVTGHSLGAAVAVLASAYIRGAMNQNVDTVYTFGAPRVGNQLFAERYYTNLSSIQVDWRLVHYHDPVPRLPWYEWYTHTEQEVYYFDEGSTGFEVCPSVRGSENHSCAWETPLIECINLDHITYLNLTLKHTDMPETCVGERDLTDGVI